jgi:hypothetical protein
MSSHRHCGFGKKHKNIFSVLTITHYQLSLNLKIEIQKEKEKEKNHGNRTNQRKSHFFNPKYSKHVRLIDWPCFSLVLFVLCCCIGGGVTRHGLTI